MTSKVNIFITGATGYIGGAIFTRLIENKDKYNVSALVRDNEKAKKIEELGAKAVIGKLDDSEILQKAAEQSDVVIHTADASDHVESCKALLAGLKQRGSSSSGSQKPIYIHTSGTGVITDRAKGEFSSDKVYRDDVKADTHENIPDTAWHRNVDLMVYEAGRSGLVNTYIVCPPLIYGTSNGPFNRDSQQVPLMIKISIKFGYPVYVGKGVNIWNNVHIEDLASFYMLLLEKALVDEAPKNDDGYYFVENGEHNFKELAEQIGKALVKHGYIKDATPKSVTEKDDVPEMLILATGSNSRCKAVKARKLGWKPVREPLFDSIDETVQRIGKTTKQ